MTETKDEPRKVSTCFEGSPCAEMMEKIIGEEGLGSLCEEMMRVLEKGHGQGRKERAEAQKQDTSPSEARTKTHKEETRK